MTISDVSVAFSSNTAVDVGITAVSGTVTAYLPAGTTLLSSGSSSAFVAINTTTGRFSTPSARTASGFVVGIGAALSVTFAASTQAPRLLSKTPSNPPAPHCLTKRSPTQISEQDTCARAVR